MRMMFTFNAAHIYRTRIHMCGCLYRIYYMSGASSVFDSRKPTESRSLRVFVSVCTCASLADD